MRALSGKGGETVKDVVARRVIASFWDRGRAHWGDEVELGILATGFKDGTKVKIAIYEEGAPTKSLKDLDSKLDKGRAKGKYKIAFEDPDAKPRRVYDLFFQAVVDGTVKSKTRDCPRLRCDADPPSFSA